MMLQNHFVPMSNMTGDEDSDWDEISSNFYLHDVMSIDKQERINTLVTKMIQ